MGGETLANIAGYNANLGGPDNNYEQWNRPRMDKILLLEKLNSVLVRID